MRRIGGWLAWCAVLFGWWLLLTDTADPAQLVAGAASAVLGASLALLLEERAAPLLPSRSWLLRIPRALARVPLDCYPLGRALFRRLVLRERVRGRLRAIRFPAGGDDEHSRARRLAATWLDSLGPNSYVIGIDRDEDVMLVHQLVPPDDPASADPMELR